MSKFCAQRRTVPAAGGTRYRRAAVARTVRRTAADRLDALALDRHRLDSDSYRDGEPIVAIDG